MPSRFTTADIERVAQLAQLELGPEEIEMFTRQLDEFLDYAAEVLAIDTSGIEPTAYVASHPLSDRDDEVRPSLDRAAALANAPDPAPAAGLFRVPRVIG
jgi:aspartyl-tRNA(Asn)/glutamyl-tRNA(Gln) amidotransferase subunit C